MATLVDTSVLGRLANRADVSHAVAQAAVAELHRRGAANAENYRTAVIGSLAELDRMQPDVREYLCLHPTELAAA